MMPQKSTSRFSVLTQGSVKKSFFFLLIAFAPLLLFAQKPISGIVRDSSGIPVPNVSISTGSKGAKAITDSAGRFRLNASKGDVLVFSSVNYEDTRLQVDDRSEYTISLRSKISSLNDVIIIGYGTTKKEDLTGSVSKAPVENMQKAPVRSFEEALAGRVAGVNVSSVDGQPGSTINITIRGANSVTQENSPLYVMTGFRLKTPITILSIHRILNRWRS